MKKEVDNKQVVSIRLSKECLIMLEKLENNLTKKNKIKFNRTMTIENCIAWQYEKEFNC